MDKKERQLIDYYYEKFANQHFDEKDLYAFLKVVEPYLEKHQEIRELSQMIFERHHHDGHVQSYLQNCEEIIEQISKTKVRKKIHYLYEFKDIRNGFNKLFQSLGYDKLPNESFNDFQLCLISLLQGIGIHSAKTGERIGHLSFAASSKELYLMGNIQVMNRGKKMPITFPVLAVQNLYEKVEPQDSNDTPYLFDDHLIEVVNIDRQLVITFPDMS